MAHASITALTRNEGDSEGMNEKMMMRGTGQPTIPLQAPLSAQLEITNRCNARCPFCLIQATGKESKELPDEKWLGVIDELCHLGVQNVIITSSGGEPLMRGQLLIQMMSRLTGGGVKGTLITNGMLLSGPLAREIVKHKWSSVQVSIHDSVARLHDEHTGLKGAFTRTMRGVENLTKWKRILRNEAPELTFRIVLTGKNFIRLPRFIRFAKTKGASKVSIRKVLNVVPHLDESFLIPEREKDRFDNIITRARHVADEIGVDLEFEFDVAPSLLGNATRPYAAPEDMPRGEGERKGHAKEKRRRGIARECPVPFSEIVIFANGIVGPCSNFVNWQFRPIEEREGIVEDVSEKPLSKIWHEGFSRLRWPHAAGSANAIPCQRCSTEMGMHTWKNAWLASFLHGEFRHLRSKGEYRKGVQFGMEQLKKYPGCAVLHQHIGEFHMELEEYEKAIGYLSRAAEFDPRMEWTRFSLGKCLFLTGRHREAEQAFMENLRLTSDRLSRFHSLIFLAMVAEARGDWATCRKRIDALKALKDCFGKEIPLERVFFKRLQKKILVPAWVTAQWNKR